MDERGWRITQLYMHRMIAFTVTLQQIHRMICFYSNVTINTTPHKLVLTSLPFIFHLPLILNHLAHANRFVKNAHALL